MATLTVSRALLTTVLLILWAAAAGAEEGQPFHHRWSALLAAHVQDGRVDYRGFKDDEAALDRYLDLLADTDPDRLPEAEQLAYYINAYNSYTVKLILNHFDEDRPVSSIRRIGGLFTSPWRIPLAVLGGKTYSLDTIEHDIVRVRFREPRIHFALNCASKSCPILMSEAYEGATLERQLRESTRNFLEDPAHNRLQGDTLWVSSIFKWYREDFDNDPLSFFLAHSGGEFQQTLRERAERIRIDYLDYDWSLNSRSD